MPAVAAVETGRRISVDLQQNGGGPVIDGPLAKFLANGHKLNVESLTGIHPVHLEVRVGTETHRSIPETSIKAIKRLAFKEKAEDGLPEDAIHIDHLLAHGKASNVLKLFGEPEQVGSSGKISQVKIGDKSTITAYDGTNSLVLTHTTEDRTQHSYMLNGAVLRDTSSEERAEGQPLGREIIFPFQKVTTVSPSDKPIIRQSATFLKIVDGHVSVSRYVRKDDPARSRIAAGLEMRHATLVEGGDSRRQQPLVRNVLYREQLEKGFDSAKARSTVDEGTKAANEVYRGALKPLLGESRKGPKVPKEVQNIEGITLGERVSVRDVLQNTQPYGVVFDAMGADVQLLPGTAKTGIRTRIVEFPAGSYATNRDIYPDSTRFLPGSTEAKALVGWGQVGIEVAENINTGERNARLLLPGEKVSLQDAHMIITNDKGLEVQFIVPGENDNTTRVIGIRTDTISYDTESAKVTARPFSKVTELFVAANNN